VDDVIRESHRQLLQTASDRLGEDMRSLTQVRNAS
jgi:hypothetical protein